MSPLDSKETDINRGLAEANAIRTFGSHGGFREGLEGKPSFYGIPPLALRRLAARCAYGRDKYGEARGWEKWTPASILLDSMGRHLNAYECGDNSEDHLAAAVWNIMVLMEQEIRAPKIYQDLTLRKGLKTDAYSPYISSKRRKCATNKTAHRDVTSSSSTEVSGTV